MLKLNNLRSILSDETNLIRTLQHVRRLTNVKYVQGQEPEPKIREYFYYVDHQGMLFLDDSRMKNFTSCFKEEKFLQFFFSRLRLNTTDRYPEFPYLSLCGRERNFVRCDDFPIVFTHLLDREEQDLLVYNHCDLLTLPFEPSKVCMLPQTGRVYHPAPEKFGSVGLIRSRLALKFAKYFKFDNGETEPPTRFIHKRVEYKLDTQWFIEVAKNSQRISDSVNRM